MPRQSRRKRSASSSTPRKRVRRDPSDPALSITATSEPTDAEKPLRMELPSYVVRIFGEVEQGALSDKIQLTPDAWNEVHTFFNTEFLSSQNARKLNLFRLIRNYVRNFVDRRREALVNLSGRALLLKYVQHWNCATKFSGYMKRVLTHMHRHWVPQNESKDSLDPVAPVTELMCMFWRNDLLLDQKGLIDVILKEFENERFGGPEVVVEPIKTAVNSFIALGRNDCAYAAPRVERDPETLSFYLNVFEEIFLARTQEHYSAKSRRIMELDCPLTMMKAIYTEICTEEDLCQRLLHAQQRTIAASVNVATKCLLTDHLDFFLDHARKMLETSQRESLANAVLILRRDERTLAPLRAMVTKNIINQGELILNSYDFNSSCCTNFEAYFPLITDLIRLHTRSIGMVMYCFPSEIREPFVAAVDISFRGLVNNHLISHLFPGLLAFYTHQILSGDIMPTSPSAETTVTKEEDVLVAVDPPETAVTSAIAHVPDQVRASSKAPNTSHLARRSNTGRTHLLAPRRSPRLSEKAQQTSGSLQKKRKIDEVSTELVAVAAPKRVKTDTPFLDSHMKEILQLFVCIEEKEQFCEQYRRHLAKRLLSGFDEEIEERVILNLEDIMGPAYASKLRGMLADVLRSEVLTVKGGAGRPKPQEVLAKLRVVNSLYWPAPNPATRNLVVPRCISAADESFSTAYTRRHAQRCLAWDRHVSSVVVYARYGRRTYVVDMSVVAASALVLFNDNQRLRLSEICQRLRTSPEAILRELRSLSDAGDVPILRIVMRRSDAGEVDGEPGVSDLPRLPTPKPVSPRRTRSATRRRMQGPTLKAEPVTPGLEPGARAYDTWVCLNLEFSSPSSKLMVRAKPVAPAAEPEMPPSRTALMAREAQIDAAIVRKLKVEKKVTLDGIRRAVTKTCDEAEPTEALLNKRLEHLIEREFIAKDAEDDNTFLYVV